MRSDTQTISIETSPDAVYAFLADGANLPRWAVGFARKVRRAGDTWMVTTGDGEMSVIIDADPGARTVDFRMSPAPGVEMLAASRVVARGAMSEYVFTQFQQAGMSDEVFEKSVAALAHELTVLKALLEVACPL